MSIYSVKDALNPPLPEKRTTNDDVQPLIKAHHHACMAEEYARAVEIISDYNLHEDLDRGETPAHLLTCMLECCRKTWETNRYWAV